MKTIPVGHIYFQMKGLHNEPDYLISWAVKQLQKGADASSIVELAGLTKPVNEQDLIQVLNSVCRDLKVDLSDVYKVHVQFIYETAHRYLVGDLNLDKCRKSIGWASTRMDGLDAGHL